MATNRITQSKEAYAVCINSDLTEGRGHRVVSAVCEVEATALRLARGANTQGTDGEVMKILLFQHSEQEDLRWRLWWYSPVRIMPPNSEDKEMMKSMKAAQAKTALSKRAVARARELGLTDEEIQAIAGNSEEEPCPDGD